MHQYSRAMKLMLALRLQPMAWALRRFHTPVHPDALVLEVGSGGNPYPRANVLLDAYENTRERHWVPLTSDRPTVLGFVENLPFKDKAFDFVIASHVLEHSTDPERFLTELQRVAKAGYIEVPDALFERLNPYRDHRLEITVRDNTLIITKKTAWINDPGLVELYEHRVKRYMTTLLMPKRPFEFHVRYYWQDSIAYRVTNPDADANWTPPKQIRPDTFLSLKSRFREWIRLGIRNLLSQRKRNQIIDVFPLLLCPACRCDQLEHQVQHLECKNCQTRYPVRNGLVAMNEPQTK
ncbi:hypothetical protein LG202_07040 [Methylobacillus methanolivorans]